MEITEVDELSNAPKVEEPIAGDDSDRKSVV